MFLEAAISVKAQQKIQRNQKNSFLNCEDEAVKDTTTVQKRVVDPLKIKTKVLNLS